MARTVRDASLETRTARLRLPIRTEPYWRGLEKGFALGYRRRAMGGTWLARRRQGDGGYAEHRIGTSDDLQDADGVAMLDYGQPKERRGNGGERRHGERRGTIRDRALSRSIRQQTSVINAIRAHLAEFGIVAPVGRQGVEQLLGVAADTNDKRLPEVARACVAALGAQLRMLKAQILQFDRMIRAWHRSNEESRRLDDIPGVGPALATALVASVADPKAFRSGRDFSAWIGLVPKQNSSGGKDKLGNISKRGDRYLRSLFTTGALAVIRYAKIHGTKHRPWLTALLTRRPTKVAAIALANKIARIAWAMMAKSERYKEPAALAA